jgi:hypothetical protein
MPRVRYATARWAARVVPLRTCRRYRADQLRTMAMFYAPNGSEVHHAVPVTSQFQPVTCISNARLDQEGPMVEGHMPALRMHSTPRAGMPLRQCHTCGAKASGMAAGIKSTSDPACDA